MTATAGQARLAHADPGVGVAPAVVTDAPIESSQVDAELISALQTLVVPPTMLVGDACATHDCVPALAGDADFSHVVTAEVAADGPDQSITMTLWTVGSDEPAAVIEDSCEICGATELLEVVGAAARAIATKTDQLTRPGTLLIELETAGATVTIDGDEVSAGEAISLSPGAHEIVATKPGFLDFTASTSIVAGVEQGLDIQLSPEPEGVVPPPALPPPADPAAGRGLRTGGYLGLGLGIAALGAGVTLMAMEEQPMQRRCTGENVDADGDCKWQYATLEGGIGLAVGGGVLIAGAIALIVVGHKRKRKSNVAVSLSPTGIFVGGRF